MFILGLIVGILITHTLFVLDYILQKRHNGVIETLKKQIDGTPKGAIISPRTLQEIGIEKIEEEHKDEGGTPLSEIL